MKPKPVIKSPFLTIPSLEGDSLEDFSIRVAEAWKIGKKGFDNGAILLIARDDRKLRIEVGYGLEGVMPDAIASRIIREVITPRFRSGDFTGGIEAGIDAMLKVTKGEILPERARPGPGSTASEGGSLMTILMITAMLALFIGMTRRRLLSGAVGGAASGCRHFIVRRWRAWICFVPRSDCWSLARSHRRCSRYRFCRKSMGR